MSDQEVTYDARNMNLLPTVAVPAAATYTTTPIEGLSGMKYLIVQARLVYGSGGTSVKVFLQTTLDNGATWFDVATLAMTTASIIKAAALSTSVAAAANPTLTDGSLADNTILNGLLGSQVRLKYIVAGTYADSTLEVWATAKG